MSRNMRPRGPAEKPKDAKRTVKRLLAYIGRSRLLLLALVTIVLAVTFMNLAGPALQGAAIDTITLTDGRPHVDFAALFTTLGVMIGVYVVMSGLQYAQGLLAARLSRGTVKALRGDVFARLAKLPISYTDSHKHGDIMSRITNDVDNISQTISQSVASLVSCVITIIGCLAIMLAYSWILTLVSFVTIPLSVFATAQISKRTRRYFLKQQQLLGKLNGHVEENVTAQKTVTAFSTQESTIASFKDISGELKGTAIRAQIFGGVMGPVMNVIGNMGFLLIAGVGGVLAFNGVITIGIIQAFILYSRQFTRPINEVANQYNAIMTAIAGAERVFEVMDYPAETDEGAMPMPKQSVGGGISFKDVAFSYKKGEAVLKGLNLDVKQGQKIAIVGATGSGKTTLVNLLTRFYELDSGEITIDGVDIATVPKNDLRRSLAIVLQDTVLFSDTIGANIRYGAAGASEDDVRRAAAVSNADHFIARLPEGYGTRLSEAGANLSQGQRQLISIARAVLADPKILILDEATSSVDTRTEMHIQDAMIALMRNRTSLIIAHRLSTIRDADRIVVIDDGRVCESGNHDELLAAKGRYYALYQAQFAGLAT